MSYSFSRTLLGITSAVLLSSCAPKEERYKAILDEQALAARVANTIESIAAGEDGIIDNKEGKALLTRFGIKYDLQKNEMIELRGTGGSDYSFPQGKINILVYRKEGKREIIGEVSVTDARRYLSEQIKNNNSKSEN